MTEITARLSTALADRYAIEHELGSGGMATVYLAEDLKHKRKVAVKVLRPELAAVLGAERFVQEITTTANLQHPHILPLFDSGEADGFLYYVMPFIDGETLRDKLNRETQLGIEEAVGITTDVADALDYAHRHNVIHRDIKPENILLHDGRPVVADFGIALAVSAAAGGRMTETGLSLGTPHYMSPEQATAEKDITNRADIYSLGSVLYEMLTGEPPHAGGSAQQIIMKIVTEHPAPVTNARKSVPPNVAAAVAKALEKLPADRFASASALADALSDPAFAMADVQAGAGRAPAATPAFSRRAMAAVLTAGALGLATGWLVRGPPPAVSPEVTRFTLQLPGLKLTAMPAFSPDGRRLGYLTQGDSSAELETIRTGRRSMTLVVGRLDRFEPELVVTTLGGMPRWINPPFFSPDGQWVGYVTAEGLEKVRLDGDGTPIRIDVDPPLGAALGASWGSDDYIVFTPDVGLGLSRVPASGGPAETLTEVDRGAGETAHAWPHVLPGRAVIYSRLTAEGFTTAVYSLDRRESIDLFSSAARVQYASSGHLVFASGGSVSAVAFDAEQLRIRGQPFPVLPDLYLSQFAGADIGWFAVSRNGSLATVRREAIARRGLTLVSRDGSTYQGLAGVGGLGPRFSPDGRFVAYTEGSHTWIYDLTAGTADPLVTGPANFVPTWSPGGEQIAVGSYALGPSNLVAVSVGTDAPPIQLLERDFRQYPQSWSPDGRLLAYVEAHPTRGRDIWTLDMQSGEATPVLATDFVEERPEFSPDGRWLAYTSDRTGRSEVYVQGFPEAGRPVRVSVEGGSDPIWRRDGTELFFRREDEFWTVDVRAGSTFTFDPPRRLFSFRAETYSLGSYDVSPDGQRFILRPRVPVVDRLQVVRNGLWEFLGDEDSRRE